MSNIHVTHICIFWEPMKKFLSMKAQLINDYESKEPAKQDHQQKHLRPG
jgi:hypothetical protein